MRKFLSISLFALLLLNLFGFYIAFVIKQGDVQKEMEALTNAPVHTAPAFISFSKNDFANIIWLRDKKEFRFNGKLYDVSRIEILKDEVKLFVIDDLAETKLIDEFVSLFHQQNEKNKTNSPLQFLLEHFLQEFTTGQITVLYHPAVSFTSFFEKDFHFSSFILNQQSPPPDLV